VMLPLKKSWPSNRGERKILAMGIQIHKNPKHEGFINCYSLCFILLVVGLVYHNIGVWVFKMMRKLVYIRNDIKGIVVCTMIICISIFLRNPHNEGLLFLRSILIYQNKSTIYV
jgi:hypothetical protein